MTKQAGDPSLGPLLSVRGSAGREVDPDSAELTCLLRVLRTSKAEALAEAAARLEGLTGDLTAFGASRRTLATASQPLTYLARAATTEPEQGQVARTGQWGPTGRFVAQLVVVIAVRDFDLLDRLAQLLARHETVNVLQTVWQVDEDNPQWRQVRADAVHAAVRKARDYAAALGGSLRSIEHLADVGLLSGGDGDSVRGAVRALGAAASGSAARETDVPDLDPEPQHITATVEARFATSGIGPVALATTTESAAVAPTTENAQVST